MDTRLNTAGAETQDQLPWSRVPVGLALIAITAVLYVGREVFLPLAVAVLLSFALAPLVSFLRRRSVPRILAVGLSVSFAFAIIAVVGLLFATQVSSLARNIPTYQANIVEKVRSLREMGAGSGVIDRLSWAVERVGAEIEKGVPAEEPEAVDPLPVEVVPRQSAIETLKNVVVPLISPFATAGLVIVVVIFILLERESLRDRFIRLVGYSDLHRTTEALEDAAGRVGRYLLMQLVVNALYAVPVTIGLALIGIPNAILWGVLALVLRFVPYIGPAIAMLPPLFLALAVAPGWELVLWTAALFLVLELVSNNVIEPWLYGSQTGLSSLAIIVAAVFWTWLWGPVGLLLSTPLTVCLVVLGRHVPQFEFFDVLLGNEPVLEPRERLYQRLLAGDADEATFHAEEFLRDRYLVDFYEEVAVPALLLAERDRQRGVLHEEGRSRVASTVRLMVENLEEIADEEEDEQDEDEADDALADPDGSDDDVPELPDGEGKSVLCLGGRGEIDDAAAIMLAQVFGIQGAEASAMSHAALEAKAIRDLDLAGVDAVVVAFVNANAAAQARRVVRRLKRMQPGLRVGIFLPAPEEGGEAGRLVEARAVNGDFVATTFPEAVIEGLADRPAVPLRSSYTHIARRKVLARNPSEAEASG